MDNNFQYVKDLILSHLSTHEGFTIPEIAQMSGFSITSVAKYVIRLKEERLIDRLRDEDHGGKGRRAVVYGIKSGSSYFVGVEVNNRELRMGMIDASGNVVGKISDNLYTFENSHENIIQVCDRIESFIASVPEVTKEKVGGVCLSLGGRVNSEAGTSASLFNFEETRETPLADILTEKLGVKVYLENDTKAMAYGDYLAYGKAWSNVLYVNISWGLGLGIIIDGKIYNGKHGYSGEFGHINAYDNNIICHCGKKGCIETEVSGRAVQRKVQERINKGESSSLSGKVRRGETINLEDIIKATDNEDPLCIEIISETARELGRHLAGMMNLFNPDCIIIGGTLARVAPFYFQQQVTLTMRQHSLKLLNRDVPALLSKLMDDAGVMGACLIARNNHYKTLSL